jgi:flagellar FliJ protein
LAEQNKHLAEVQSEEKRAVEMYSDSARGETRSDGLLAARRYLSMTEQQVVGQQKNVAAAEQQVEEKRFDLVEKTRNKEILDRLRERRLAEYTVWAQREKQKQIDETARHNYFRKRKAEE